MLAILEGSCRVACTHAYIRELDDDTITIVFILCAALGADYSI